MVIFVLIFAGRAILEVLLKIAVTVILAVPAIVWWGKLLDWIIRGRGLVRLCDRPVQRPDDSPWPSLSVIVPARDEDKWVETAVRSLAIQDYPALNIIVVDDRSSDRTAVILDSLGVEFNNITVEHVQELPKGWLGKTHALWRGVQQAGAVDWLLFTDADVIHEPGTLRRAVLEAELHGIDLLTLYPGMILRGFWEKAMISYFGLLVSFSYPSWRVNNPRSGAYYAIGAFILVQRQAYERSGSHRRIALEVVDDVRLCWMMKRNGARVKLLIGQGSIRIRWHEGLWGIVNGLTKNFFASLGYSLWMTFVTCVGLILVSVCPFVGLLGIPHIWGWLSLATVAAIFVSHGVACRASGIGPGYSVAHPITGLLMVYLALKSAVTTLRNRGIRWRDTFYPLDVLRSARK